MMRRDNEERGRLLEARSKSNQNKRAAETFRFRGPARGSKARMMRLKDRAWLLAMLALLWGAHVLMRLATRLFFRGLLSANHTRRLLRWAAWLNRKSLSVLRRRQRRRLFNHYAGNDNHDRRT